MNKKLFLINIIIILTILAGCKNYDDISQSNDKTPIISPYSSENNFDVTLYYPDKNLERLVPKTIRIEDITNNLEIEVLEKLIEGIKDKDIKNLIPQKTKVRSIDISDQIAYINLSKEVNKEDITQEEEALLIYSIVNTMTQIDSINSVQILIDGERKDIFSNYYNIESPLKYSELIVKTNYVDPIDTIKKYYDIVKRQDPSELVDIFKEVDKKSRIAYGMQHINRDIKQYNIEGFKINNYKQTILVDVRIKVITNEDKEIDKNHVFSLVYVEEEDVFKISDIYE
ncbi:GerMN domain-containing protein [Clostridium sp. D2Q-11]|uniref:GerMN domain-containing protein n=1 Tax=Anaeromonas frigoriresistens TaxID=2683708 RepID=A0A942UWZ4_9FIRM|nr:GerMN domain-containing protein [Anaeromonas frigoriresistens]MBS4537147.1 GerMN domain-containing protein [Anaeromonas frigoriresistens]